MTTSPSDMDDAIAAAGLTPGESPSPLLVPVPSKLFAARARRLRALAPGHALEGWLAFIAVLVEAQVKLAPADAGDADAGQAWPDDLVVLLGAIDGPLPPPALAALAALKAATPVQVRDIQDRIDAGQARSDDLAAAPFLAAARQLAWTRQAARVVPAMTTPPATAHKCPVCGEAPVAGIIQIGSESAGLRYLHCGLCGTAWHHVRASCIACGDARGVVYHGIDGGDDGVRAECCQSCDSTLKLFLLEKNPAYDPVVDDMATLTLDLLVGEAGFRRIGGNPFLVMGA